MLEGAKSVGSGVSTIALAEAALGTRNDTKKSIFADGCYFFLP